MAITYNAGTNVITVTGYTEATPCTFLDVYNADISGGWGKVTRQCTNQFCFDCFLQIGDASTATWFADTKKQIYWSQIGTTWDKYIVIKNNAHFRLGVLVDDTKKVTRDGCIISLSATSERKLIFGDHVGADIQIYSSCLNNYGTTRIGTFATDTSTPLKIYNSLIGTGGIYGMNLNLYNVTITGTKSISSTLGLFYTSGTVDIIKIFDVYYALYTATGGTNTYENIVCKHYDRLHISSGGTMYVINGEMDVWHFVWGAGSGHICYRKYEFDLKVIDKDSVAINAATVKIWDKDSNLIIDTTTNASGVIATQTITRGYYNQANGNTLQEASPHLIKIEKAGYTMYEADFTLEDKTDWTIALQSTILRNPSMTGGMV